MTELSPYHEDQELDNNTSDNIHFRDILEQHISRRVSSLKLRVVLLH